MLEEFIFGVTRRGRQLRARQAQREGRRPVAGVDRRAGRLHGARGHLDPARRRRQRRPAGAPHAREARPGARRAARRDARRGHRPRRARWSSSTVSATRVRSTRTTPEVIAKLRRAVVQRGAHHRELPVGARRHRRHLQRLPAVAHPRLRLVRSQLGLQQRLGGESPERQARRSSQQQPAVVQDPGEDLLRAERRPLPGRHAGGRARHDRDRRDHDQARLRRQDRSTCCTVARTACSCRSSTRSGPSRRSRGQGRSRADARSSSPTRSSRSAAARRWMPRRSCGCSTRTPRCEFSDMREKFFDVRKRAFTFPELGKLAKLVCIPTTSGTGSEMTPFAVITDDETGMKYPLADYALTPSVAIIDPVLTTSPSGLPRRRRRVRRADPRHRGVRVGLRERLHRRSVPARHQAHLREHRAQREGAAELDGCRRHQGPREDAQRGIHLGHGVRQRVPRNRARDGSRDRVRSSTSSTGARTRLPAARDPLQRQGPDQAHELAEVRALRRPGALPGDRPSPGPAGIDPGGGRRELRAGRRGTARQGRHRAVVPGAGRRRGAVHLDVSTSSRWPPTATSAHPPTRGCR